MSLLVISVIVAFITWYVATMMPMFLRWSFYMGGPLVGGLVCGLLFGDVSYGLKVGATIQLAYLGAIAVGGILPSELAIAGYLGTALTIAAGLEPAAALTVAVALGSLGLLCRNANMTLNAIVVHQADKYAAAGNARMVRRMNQYGSQVVPFLVYFLPSLVVMYVGAPLLSQLMQVIPLPLIKALSVTGGLIPALGIGMLLQYVWERQFLPYFVIGFFLVAYLKLNIMLIAILGACMAAIYIFNSEKGV